MTSIELTKAQGGAKSFTGGGEITFYSATLKKYIAYRVLVTLLQWKTIDVVIKHKLYDNSRLMILKFLIGILP